MGETTISACAGKAGLRDYAPSEAETRVIRAVAAHGTIRAAAAALHLSTHTVDAHLDNLRRRTERRFLPQLVAWAAANGLLREDGSLE